MFLTISFHLNDKVSGKNRKLKRDGWIRYFRSNVKELKEICKKTILHMSSIRFPSLFTFFITHCRMILSRVNRTE